MLINQFKHAYFIGIGGTGMNGIANILLDQGYKVSGSDFNSTAVIEKLAAKGAKIYNQHLGENITDDVDVIVVSTAIPKDNPEIVEGKRLGIEIVQRAEMLAYLMKSQKAICVAGAHGKTTTSSMISLVLKEGGLDPTIVVGGELSNIGGNAQLGKGEYLVAEADESDGSFLKLHPWAAVVTNIEADHLDHYGSLDKIIEAFKEFVKLPGEDGLAVLGIDSPEVEKLIGDTSGKIVTYSVEKTADYEGRNLRQERDLNKAEIYYKGQFLGDLELNVPGKHNISNGLAAIAIGHQLGLDFQVIADGLKQFYGVKRRFQLLGEVNSIKVVDDYAHHPTEVAATLEAANSSHEGRVIAVFQPHRYTRTKFLAKEFADSFAKADQVILTDIYSAGEKNTDNISSEIIIEKMPKDNRAVYIPMDELNEYLLGTVKSGDLVLTLGAGNIWRIGQQLVANLGKKIQ